MAAEFETWATQLRLAWMGTRARRIVGGWASLGDKATAWARQAQLEHFPEHALDPVSLALLANERGIEPGPSETMAALATRLTYARVLNQLRGRPIGLALALYYADFPEFVIVQQNGRAWQITGTPVLADLVDAVAPPSWATITALGMNPNIAGSPPWWTFDLDDAFTSRFAVLFPGPWPDFPTSFRTIARATFTAAETAAVVWPNAFDDTSYRILVGPATVTSGSGPVAVAADGSSKTRTGSTIMASAPFTGTADVIAYQVGANPFADPHPQDLARLRRVIRDWRPAKATCTGIDVAVQGQMIGWPVRAISGSALIGPSTVVHFSAE